MFKQMQEVGCILDVVIFSIFFEVYGKYGCYDEVWFLFIDMKERGIEFDVNIYNIFI